MRHSHPAAQSKCDTYAHGYANGYRQRHGNSTSLSPAGLSNSNRNRKSYTRGAGAEPIDPDASADW